MARHWVTTMSTHPESVVNPLIAACEGGYVPTEIQLLSNRGPLPWRTTRWRFASVPSGPWRESKVSPEDPVRLHDLHSQPNDAVPKKINP